MASADPPVPSIHAQAEAVELLTVNHNGHVEILRDLVKKGRRTPQELAMAEAYLPALVAAVRTMKYIHKHAEQIRADLRLPLTTGASGDDNPPSKKLAAALPSGRPKRKAVRSPKK